MGKFVKTKDEETAEDLKCLGFQFLCKEGDYFVFLNNSTRQVCDLNNTVFITNQISG